ncbi:MAG: hypothetical protein WDO70_05200 [Alphaproteobacteria bacterium]
MNKMISLIALGISLGACQQQDPCLNASDRAQCQQMVMQRQQMALSYLANRQRSYTPQPYMMPTHTYQPAYTPPQPAPSYIPPAPVSQPSQNAYQWSQNYINNLPTQKAQQCSMTPNGAGGFIQRCW